jgi:hypothetical protein
LIYDSSFWKDDLLKLAKKLELRLAQKRWSEKSYFAVEKEIFLGFYSIRKLIESQKISESIANKIYKVYEFPKSSKDISLIDGDFSEEFDFSKSKIVEISIVRICNQFIHSYFFGPLVPEGKSLIGFFICSDHKRKSGIYFISIFDVVEIYRLVGNNYPSKMSAERISVGKVNTIVE